VSNNLPRLDNDYTRTEPPRWSRILLWPGAVLLGVHGLFMLQLDTTNLDKMNAWVRFLGAASVIPIIAQAMLIAGLVSLVLEEHQPPEE
jgi:hypothetical protein